MKVPVNRIIPFSSVDGPGNRTAIFLQGCNIDCKYCHNPETRCMCTGCGLCVEQCPGGALTQDKTGKVFYDPVKCVRCDTCTKVCPNDSCPRTVEMTPEEVYASVRKQIPFIRGITVSGGECMLYPKYVTELFSLAKKDGLTTLIDSNGTISFQDKPELLAVTDGVMLDIKAFDNEDHRRVTGSDNQMVLENAAFLAQQKKLYEVRAVIVPDLYDGEKSIRGIANYLGPYLSIKRFRAKIIAYRPMGVREEYSHYKIPDPAYLADLAEILKDHGFTDVIII